MFEAILFQHAIGTTVLRAKLCEDVSFVAIHHSANGVGDEMTSVPGADLVEGRTCVQAPQSCVVARPRPHSGGGRSDHGDEPSLDREDKVFRVMVMGLLVKIVDVGEGFVGVLDDFSRALLHCAVGVVPNPGELARKVSRDLVAGSQGILENGRVSDLKSLL